jgi:NAD(P)-dependent dehydrogenase (short-subunit alcohol dehydrogenase family)
MNSQDLLAERTIIVTGAATGIGQAFAIGAAAQGANVVVADMNAADETVATIEAAGGRALHQVTRDERAPLLVRLQATPEDLIRVHGRFEDCRPARVQAIESLLYRLHRLHRLLHRILEMLLEWCCSCL